MSQEPMHSLLKRQLKRQFGESWAIPEEWRSFILAVNNAYREFDVDREMLERSLDLSSQELLQANSEARAMFQAIPDLLFRIDHEGTILGFKAGAMDDLILTPQAMIGKRIQDVPDKRIGELFREAIRRAPLEKSVVSIEYALNMQGEEYCYEARLVPLLEKQIVVIIRNITGRKRLEEQFRQAQKMEAFGQLAGGVAHDFNNILTVIQGNVSLLQMASSSPDELSQTLDEVSGAVERAANLTRQLLTFSRRRPIQSRVIDLNEVAADMTKMLQRLIGEHIMLETRFAPGGALVDADVGMMSQVVMNLVVNSRDAMPSGGRLILQTSAVVVDEARAKQMPNARPGSFVCLSITDTGGGIAPEDLPHIFEPFYTTKEVGKGTGLGLATVFGIVEQHHGWICVASQLNQGTTVSIYLPRRAKEAVAPPAAGRSAPAVRGGTETVLVVEDEASVRQLMRRMLIRGGYQVYEAGSGASALQLWETRGSSIDLVITDMVMPDGVGGWELATRLRAARPGLKVIFISGYTDDVLGEDSILREKVDFIEKPFEPIPFLQRVRAVLDARP